MSRPPPTFTLFPYTTLFRSHAYSDPRVRLTRLVQVRENAHFVLVSVRSEEHTSELQSLRHLVCRLLLEKKKYRERRRNSDFSRTRFSHACDRRVGPAPRHID